MMEEFLSRVDLVLISASFFCSFDEVFQKHHHVDWPDSSGDRRVKRGNVFYLLSANICTCGILIEGYDIIVL